MTCGIFFGDIATFEIMAIINEGLQYHLLIDPFLERVYSRAAAMIEPGARVIDIATISMAIHQFSTETGLHILQQLKKISRSVVIIDYAFPQPRNFNGFIVRSIERIAGKEHLANFRAYQHGSGMPGILHRLGIIFWEPDRLKTS